jgi:hypothetical protein
VRRSGSGTCGIGIHEPKPVCVPVRSPVRAAVRVAGRLLTNGYSVVFCPPACPVAAPLADLAHLGSLASGLAATVGAIWALRQHRLMAGWRRPAGAAALVLASIITFGGVGLRSAPCYVNCSSRSGLLSASISLREAHLVYAQFPRLSPNSSRLFEAAPATSVRAHARFDARGRL